MNIFQPLPRHLVLTSAALFAVGHHQTAHTAPRFLETTNFRYHFVQDDKTDDWMMMMITMMMMMLMIMVIAK